MIYAVINPDGTYAGVPCESLEEAREMMAQKEGRWIAELIPVLTESNPILIPEEKTIPCLSCPYYDPSINQCLYIGNVAPCEEEDFDEDEEDFIDEEEEEYFWNVEIWEERV